MGLAMAARQRFTGLAPEVERCVADHVVEVAAVAAQLLQDWRSCMGHKPEKNPPSSNMVTQTSPTTDVHPLCAVWHAAITANATTQTAELPCQPPFTSTQFTFIRLLHLQYGKKSNINHVINTQIPAQTSDIHFLTRFKNAKHPRIAAVCEELACLAHQLARTSYWMMLWGLPGQDTPPADAHTRLPAPLCASETATAFHVTYWSELCVFLFQHRRYLQCIVAFEALWYVHHNSPAWRLPEPLTQNVLAGLRLTATGQR
jgi:hypothetical protein